MRHNSRKRESVEDEVYFVLYAESCNDLNLPGHNFYLKYASLLPALLRTYGDENLMMLRSDRNTIYVLFVTSLI